MSGRPVAAGAVVRVEPVAGAAHAVVAKQLVRPATIADGGARDAPQQEHRQPDADDCERLALLSQRCDTGDSAAPGCPEVVVGRNAGRGAHSVHGAAEATAKATAEPASSPPRTPVALSHPPDDLVAEVMPVLEWSIEVQRD